MTLLRQAIEDCTTAFSLLQVQNVSSQPVQSLREKILYRRASANFLLGELNSSAQDLLTVLSIDKNNVAASKLLRAVRKKHELKRVDNTPLARIMNEVKEESQRLLNRELEDHYERLHEKVKSLFAILSQDISSLSMEFGRRGGFESIWKMANYELENVALPSLHEELTTIRVLALQMLSCVCSFKPFAEHYAIPPHFQQSELATLIAESCGDSVLASKCLASNRLTRPSVAVAGIALFLRIVIAFDEDSSEKLPKKLLVDDKSVCRACVAALRCTDKEPQKAALDLISTWSSPDKDFAANAIISSISDLKKDKKKKLSKIELNKMAPRDFAAYTKQEYEEFTRAKERSKSNSLLFCDKDVGGLYALLSCAASSDDARHIREICVVIGRLMSQVENDTEVKSVAENYLACSDEDESITIEEIDETDEKSPTSSIPPALHKGLLLSGLLAISLFYTNGDLGVWAMEKGLSNGKSVRSLIESGNFREMFVASEVVAACASSDKGRALLRPILDSGSLDYLIESDNAEVSSGAASAIAKLGMASKLLTQNEGEMVGMLQLAVDLIYEDMGGEGQQSSTSPDSPSTTIERGVEVLSYLTSRTSMKDEVAHGFKSSNHRKTALERLVELASLHGAGESRYAYGLAVICASLCVSGDTLRKEAFADKEITPEEYEQLQSLMKTQEEKEQSSKELEKDSEEAVKSRIRKMAASNVPRAIVKLIDGTGESTQEQLVITMNRMASEESVRGVMIQQGCLSACLKLEKDVVCVVRRQDVTHLGGLIHRWIVAVPSLFILIPHFIIFLQMFYSGNRNRLAKEASSTLSPLHRKTTSHHKPYCSYKCAAIGIYQTTYFSTT